MNFSQIWEVIGQQFQSIGWFDREWPKDNLIFTCFFLSRQFIYICVLHNHKISKKGTLFVLGNSLIYFSVTRWFWLTKWLQTKQSEPEIFKNYSRVLSSFSPTQHSCPSSNQINPEFQRHNFFPFLSSLLETLFKCTNALGIL